MNLWFHGCTFVRQRHGTGHFALVMSIGLSASIFSMNGHAETAAASHPFWAESTVTGNARNMGLQSEAGLAGSWRGGTQKSSGGAINEEVTFKHKESVYGFAGRIGYMDKVNVGGGLLLNTSKESITDTASIDTVSTKTNDNDAISSTSTATNVTPHFNYSKGSTGDALGFGFGLGYALRQLKSERTITIADRDSPSATTTAKAGGAVVAARLTTADWAFNLSLAPSLKGSIDEGTSEATIRTETHYVIESECLKMGYRLGLELTSVKDEYPTSTLTGSGWLFRVDGDRPMASIIRAVPRFSYKSESKTRGDSTAKVGTLALGTRFVQPGAQSYFTGFGFDYVTGSESRGSDRPDSQLKQFGLNLEFGLNI